MEGFCHSSMEGLTGSVICKRIPISPPNLIFIFHYSNTVLLTGENNYAPHLFIRGIIYGNTLKLTTYWPLFSFKKCAVFSSKLQIKPNSPPQMILCFLLDWKIEITKSKLSLIISFAPQVPLIASSFLPFCMCLFFFLWEFVNYFSLVYLISFSLIVCWTSREKWIDKSPSAY